MQNTAITQCSLKHELQLKTNRVPYGSANWSKQSSYRWFETRWRPCGVSVMKQIYCRYIIRMIYSVIRLRLHLYLHMSSIWLNQIIHISLQCRYRSTITSPITGDTTVCSCASATWHQRKSQSSNYCPFLRGIHRWLVDSRHKGRVMRKLFPCHDGIIRS